MNIVRAHKEMVLDFRTKYKIVFGGSGSAKSYSVCQHWIIKLLQSPRTLLVVRRTGTSLNDSVVALFKRILSDEGIPYTYNKMERVLKFGSSTVLFKPLEDSERLKSLTDVTDAWVEEATEIRPDDFIQITLRVRPLVDDSEIILTFNPISKLNWVWRFFFDTDSPEYFLCGKDYKIWKSTYLDNPFLPRSYVENLKQLRVSSPYYYQVYALGEFGVLGKLIFPQGTYQIKNIELPPNPILIAGMDPGATDKFAVTLSAYIKSENILYTFKEFSASEVLCKDVAAWIKSNIPQSVQIFADPAGKAQIKELKSLGVWNISNADKLPGSVQADIDKLHSLNWIISPSCTDLTEDLMYYSYKKDKDTGLYTNEPERSTEGHHQNSIDSCRYSLRGLGNQIKVIDCKWKGL